MTELDLQSLRKQILLEALEGRQKETLMYQINIDNYRAALTQLRLKPDPEMESFAEQLAELLQTSLFEQKKELLMINVIEKQLEA